MALTGIKDIDYIILDKLDNVSCENFTKVFTEYDTREFWKRRMMNLFEREFKKRIYISERRKFRVKCFSLDENINWKFATISRI